MGDKQIHDKYGKEVMRQAFGSSFNAKVQPVSFGKLGGTARIDGTLDGVIAVEIESRVSKQVRGALVDLAMHPHKKKLLVVLPRYGNDLTANQSEYILEKICKKGDFVVARCKGSGSNHQYEADVKIVQAAVEKLKTMPGP
jgi:hypothetical protein